MKTYIAILVISALVSFGVTPWVLRLARMWGAMDIPDARKVHKEPMARLGGLAVFLGFCSPWAGFYLLDNLVSATFQNYERLFLSLVIGASLMLVLGIYDDIRGCNALQKFAVQIVTAIGLYYGGFQITVLSNPFGPVIHLGWLSMPVSVLWIVGLTNAVNLLDGIDGLAVGVTGCLALSLALINIMTGNIIVALLTLCLAGACFGFLPHNFSPARIFMGDSGSLFIGVVLACISILSLFKVTTVTFILVPMMLFGLPLFDTTSVFIGRLLRGVPLFRADKTHIHHRLLRLGWTHQRAALLLYAITLALGAVAIYFHTAGNTAVGPTAVAIATALVVLIWAVWRERTKPNG